MKFDEAKVTLVTIKVSDVITGSEPTKTNSNDSQFVPSGGFTIGK